MVGSNGASLMTDFKPQLQERWANTTLSRRTLIRAGAMAIPGLILAVAGYRERASAASKKGGHMTTAKGERTVPLFTSEADARTIIHDYCVNEHDEPLTPEQIGLLISRLIPQFWVAQGDGDGAIGATRFGGAPDMGKGAVWPMRKALPDRSKAEGAGRFPNPWVVRQLSEEVPFEFVAQIDLEEAARHPLHAAGLPNNGRLLLFMDMGVLMENPAAPADACFTVHDETPREELERLAIPERFNEMETWWRTPDPKQASHFEEIAKSLEAQGMKDAAEATRKAANEAANSNSALRKPFVYPSRAMKLVPLVVPPDKMTNELTADAALKALAEDGVAGQHYGLLTGNDTGPFSADPNNFRRTQPWLTLEARRNRLLGPPQPEQDDPRFDLIPESERPAYPWNDPNSQR